MSEEDTGTHFATGDAEVETALICSRSNRVGAHTRMQFESTGMSNPDEGCPEENMVPAFSFSLPDDFVCI